MALHSPKVRLSTLAIVVAVLALLFAGLARPSELWATLHAALTSLILATAILKAVYPADSPRAFWIGFALFGWLYQGDLFLLHERLTRSANLADYAIAHLSYFVIPQAYTMDANGQVIAVSGDLLSSFQTVGHCFMTLLSAFVGGLLATYLERTHRSTGPTS